MLGAELPHSSSGPDIDGGQVERRVQGIRGAGHPQGHDRGGGCVAGLRGAGASGDPPEPEVLAPSADPRAPGPVLRDRVLRLRIGSLRLRSIPLDYRNRPRLPSCSAGPDTAQARRAGQDRPPRRGEPGTSSGGGQPGSIARRAPADPQLDWAAGLYRTRGPLRPHRGKPAPCGGRRVGALHARARARQADAACDSADCVRGTASVSGRKRETRAHPGATLPLGGGDGSCAGALHQRLFRNSTRRLLRRPHGRAPRRRLDGLVPGAFRQQDEEDLAGVPAIIGLYGAGGPAS